jgi:hypothetical protein
MSFVEMIKTARKEQLYIVYGRDNGKAAWYCIQVDQLKLAVFKAHLKTKPDVIHLDSYGKVLYCGWGKNPPQDIINEIRDQYS